MAVAVLYGAVSYDTDPTGIQSDDEQRTRPTLPEGWQRFADGAFTFRFMYPHGAEITTNMRRGYVKVQRTGSRQKPNTEVTDGYTVWIRNIRQGQATSQLRHVAHDIYEREVTDDNRVEALATTTHNGDTAYTFANTTQLGNTVQHKLWRVPGNSYIYVTYSISGPDDMIGAYRQRVIRILDSVRIRQ